MRYVLALIVALVLGTTAALAGYWSLAALAPVFALLCVAWPSLGAGGLIAACAIDRFNISTGGANVRLDELVALALAAALIVRSVLRPRRRALPRTADCMTVSGHLSRPYPAEGRKALFSAPLLVPLIAYCASNLLSTIGAPANLSRSLSYDLITLDLVILYFGLVAYLRTPRRVVSALHLWLGVAAVEAIVGVMAYALFHAMHAAVFGVQFDPATGAPMVYGTMWEANIFGSYMSGSFLLALALATEETERRKGLLYVTCLLTAIGLILSATRSAWGATLVGAVLLIGLLRFGLRARVGRGGRRPRTVARLVAGLATIVLVLSVALTVLPSSVTGALTARAAGLLNFASGSGYGRLLLYQEALSEWQSHPWLGTGPGSFAYRLPGDMSTGPAWLPNLTLQALHDTGVLGLLAMVWLFVAFYATTLRALHRAPPGTLRAGLAGCVAAVTALLISFQLTPGFLLGYSWALLALTVAAAGAVAALDAQPDRARLSDREAAPVSGNQDGPVGERAALVLRDDEAGSRAMRGAL